jgi:polysaccharide deacetylase family protein (PEP-CTERM system associated)
VQNFLTVDVEEWYHVCGVGGALAPERWDTLASRVELTTDLVLELLADRRVRATFFVLGWIAERHPSLIERIAREGHEIGSHGFSHRRVYEIGPDEFGAELARSCQAIQAAGGGRPRGFRAPEWSINDRSLWALDVVARHGFRYDSSMTPLRLVGNPAYPQAPHLRGTPSGPLLEVPPLVRRRFGQNVPLGGGWGLRMCPASVALREIAARNRRGEPATLFVHPWEMDPDPPRVSLPWALAFSHYYRLAGYRERLNDIIGGAAFGPIGESVDAAWPRLAAEANDPSRLEPGVAGGRPRE